MDVSDIDAWFLAHQEQIMALMRQGYNANRALASVYLRAHARASGSSVVVTARQMNETKVWRSIEKMGPAGIKAYLSKGIDANTAVSLMLKSIEGSAYRHLFDGSRETISSTIQNAGTVAGWRRTSVGTPCTFCAMLISRGAVYSKGTVHFQAHDNDKCIPEPLYRQTEEPAHVQALQDLWQEATRGLSGSEAIAAFGRALKRNPGG